MLQERLSLPLTNTVLFPFCKHYRGQVPSTNTLFPILTQQMFSHLLPPTMVISSHLSSLSSNVFSECPTLSTLWKAHFLSIQFVSSLELAKIANYLLAYWYIILLSPMTDSKGTGL